MMITQAQAARFNLARHGLAARLKGGPGAAVQGAVALQAQMPPMPYLQAWARVEGFLPEQVDAALYAERSLVRTWIVRGTLHIIRTRDLPLYLAAMGAAAVRSEEAWWVKHFPRAEGRVAEVAAELRQHLSDGPLTRAELAVRARGTLLGELLALPWGGVFRGCAYAGVTVHAQPAGNGDWTGVPDYRFALLEHWLPDLPPLPPPGEAEAALVRRYLGSFGPASARDVAHWTGWPLPRVRSVLSHLAPELVEVEMEGQRGAHYLLAADAPALISGAGLEGLPVRLLPRFDPLLLGHADKARFLAAAHRRAVFTPGGHVHAVLLVDGRVAGLWSYARKARGLVVTVMPWHTLAAPLRRMVAAEAEGLAALFKQPLHALEIRAAAGHV